MGTSGQLCYQYGGTALCYKNGGTQLIYKVDTIQNCTIKVKYGKQNWICTTYDAYHVIQYSCTGTGLSVVESSEGFDESIFVVRPTANGTFQVSVIASTSCSALESEEPGATCTVSVNQKGVSPKVAASIPCLPNVAKSVYISFDSNGKLSNITY